VVPTVFRIHGHTESLTALAERLVMTHARDVACAWRELQSCQATKRGEHEMQVLVDGLWGICSPRQQCRLIRTSLSWQCFYIPEANFPEAHLQADISRLFMQEVPYRLRWHKYFPLPWRHRVEFLLFVQQQLLPRMDKVRPT
jgi:hypothetical protein